MTFQENGLPAGCLWSVQFGSSYSSSSGSSIIFTSAPGSFNYFIYYGNQSSYISEGTASVQNDVVITINIYNFSVDLKGNTDHLPWYGIVHAYTGYTCKKESNGSSMEFYLPGGFYNYAVLIHEFGKNVTVCSNSTTISSDSQVSVLLRSITFDESGIPMGHQDLSWNAVLNYYGAGLSSNIFCRTMGSTNNSSFTVFYPYSVSFPVYIINILNNNLSFRVSTGNINLSSTSEIENLNFSNISVKAGNISYGTQWGLTVFSNTVEKVFGFRTIDAASNLYLLNGTYSYKYYLYSNYSDGNPTFSSTCEYNLTVPALSDYINANFTGIVDLKVRETGLGLKNSWETQVTGENISFDLIGKSEFLTAPVSSGSYYINFTSGSTSLLNGSAYVVNSADSTVNVSFYRLSFDETGLSDFNAFWTIQLFKFGQSGSISTDYLGKTTDITFFVINGTYNFALNVYFFPSGYYFGKSFFDYSSSVSTPIISGSNLTVNITFFPKPGLYLVHFEVEFNGPGSLYLRVYNQFVGQGITLDFSASNANQSINCIYENQTLAVTCCSNGYSNTTSYSVEGANLTISLNLSWLQYSTVVFHESGLPAGTSWNVSAEGQIHSSNTSKIYFTFSSQNIFFTVKDSGSFYPSPASGRIEISFRAQTLNISFNSPANASFGIVSKTIDVANSHIYAGLFQNYPGPLLDGFIPPFYIGTNFYRNLIVSSGQASIIYFLNNSQYDSSSTLYRYSSSSGSLISLTNPESYYSLPAFFGELHLIGLSSNGSCLYVTAGNRLFMISTASLEPVECHIIGPRGFTISSMIMDKSTGKMYAVDSNTGGVQVTGMNGTNLDYIPLSNLSGFQANYPEFFVCNPDNGYLFIHYGFNRFVCLNTEYDILGGTFAVDYRPVAATFIPTLDQIAVVGYYPGPNETFYYNLSLINAGTMKFVSNTSLSGLPSGIIFDPQDKMLYVSEISLIESLRFRGLFLFTTGHIAVIDPLSIYRTISNISVGSNPMTLSETANGSSIFVQNSGDGNLVVINVAFGSAILQSYPSQTLISGIIITGSLVAGAAVGYLWFYRRPDSRSNSSS
ncbi:MAG: YncE family protein [Thermoplasmata archaeon]